MVFFAAASGADHINEGARKTRRLRACRVARSQPAGAASRRDVADILVATARRRPQHPALIWGERVISYAELCHIAFEYIGSCPKTFRRLLFRMLSLLLTFI
jgi:hypothetical protein